MKRFASWLSFVAVVSLPFALTACDKIKGLLGGGEADAGSDAALAVVMPGAAAPTVPVVDPAALVDGAAPLATAVPTGTVVVVKKPDGGVVVVAVDAGAAVAKADAGAAPVPTPTLSRPALPSTWPSNLPIPTTIPTVIPTIPTK